VNLLLQAKMGGSYLEIGCDTNALFDAIPIQDKTGVDPVQGGNRRATSDEFFSTNQRKFDVIFIDGLHTYDQVRRDVVNSIRILKAGGWVALHDLLPATWVEEHVPRIGEGAWTGDVWKVAFELAVTPGVNFRMVKIDRGVGAFRLISDNVVLTDRRSELSSMTFDYLYNNIARLPLCSWDEAHVWITEANREKL
jgi:hypothetical protein